MGNNLRGRGVSLKKWLTEREFYGPYLWDCS
jgi:hypothetical protein